MIVLEVVGALILLVLMATTTWMALVGLLGVVGATRLRRCRSCGHFLASGPPRASGDCPYCRHPWLLHHVMPVHLHHLLPEEMAPAEPTGTGTKVAHLG